MEGDNNAQVSDGGETMRDIETVKKELQEVERELEKAYNSQPYGIPEGGSIPAINPLYTKQYSLLGEIAIIRYYLKQQEAQYTSVW
jgi:hypothetical protein